MNITNLYNALVANIMNAGELTQMCTGPYCCETSKYSCKCDMVKSLRQMREWGLFDSTWEISPKAGETLTQGSDLNEVVYQMLDNLFKNGKYLGTQEWSAEIAISTLTKWDNILYQNSFLEEGDPRRVVVIPWSSLRDN